MGSSVLMVAAVLVAGNSGGATGAEQSVDVTEQFSSEYQACVTYGETHAGAALPIAECDARELRAQDARLNATYESVMARLSSARKATLRAEERRWIVARDRKCGALPDVDLTAECNIHETIQRSRYLRRRLN
jgi:uncharacterized protein YecT (DUF1311 family)